MDISAANVVAVGIIEGTTIVALQRAEDRDKTKTWLVPYLCITTDAKPHVLQRFKVECAQFGASSMNVTAVEVEDEIDLKREMFWYTAARNLLAAYRDATSGLSMTVASGFFSDVMSESKSNFRPAEKFDGAEKTQLEQVQEAAAWFFTMTFAASQSEIYNRIAFGWQKYYRFLAAYNQTLASNNVGAFAKERGWNDGLDPANDLGPCIVPNNGIDGRIIGAAKLWKSNTWNNFGLTDDAAWAYTARQTENVGLPLGSYPDRPKTLEPGTVEMRPCLRELADAHYATTVCQAYGDDDGLDGTVLTRDDGGTRQKAADTHRKDMTPRPKPPVVLGQQPTLPAPTVKNPAEHGPATGPAAVQMASVFGTLSHEAALTEMLGAAYPHVAGALPADAEALAKTQEAERQIAKVRGYLMEFPTLCDRIGSVLATTLLKGSVRLAAHLFDTNQVRVRGAAPGLVSVDLQSALPYVYPFPAAVPDALFCVERCDAAAATAKPRTVVGEFKTKWGGGVDGFRWAVGDGKAFRRQALFETLAHWATCGSMATDTASFSPHEAWAVVAKTPRRPTVETCAAYSACCHMETSASMFRQVSRLYGAIFDPGAQYCVDDDYASEKFKSALPGSIYVDPERWYDLNADFDSEAGAAKVRSLWLHKRGGAVLEQQQSVRKKGITVAVGTQNSYEYRPLRYDLQMTVASALPELSGAGIELAFAFSGGSAKMLQLCIDAAVCCCKSTDALWCSRAAEVLIDQYKKCAGNPVEMRRAAGQLEMLLSRSYVPDSPRRPEAVVKKLAAALAKSRARDAEVPKLLNKSSFSFIVDDDGNLMLNLTASAESKQQQIMAVLRSEAGKLLLLPCKRPTRLCYTFDPGTSAFEPRLFEPPAAAVGIRKKAAGGRGAADFRQANYKTVWKWDAKTKKWNAPPAQDRSSRRTRPAAGALHEPIITTNPIDADADLPVDGVWKTWPVFGAGGADNVKLDETLARINADVEKALSRPVIRTREDVDAALV